MCRFFIYIGDSIKLNKLFKPTNSILKQSIHTPFTPFQMNNQRDHCINGDGFGICWRKDSKIYFYKSIKPPWNDCNILNLSDYIESDLFLCHIRAVKPFVRQPCVNEQNCHPFIYKNLSWMHNGQINNKEVLCKYLYDNCSLDLLKHIKGTTDSEYCFFIFIYLLEEEKKNNVLNVPLSIINIMKECIKIIISLVDDIVSLNFSIYDGTRILCTRYINSNDENPPSLYYSKNLDIGCKNNNIIISSEPITINDSEWIIIPKNNLILVTDGEIIIEEII